MLREAQKKGEPLGQLSRSSGCIYLADYNIFVMGVHTPFFVTFYEIFVKKL
jgi:hypothetical protein